MRTRKLAPIYSWIIIACLLASLCTSLTLTPRSAAQTNKLNKSASPVEQTESWYPLLSKYATDLTGRALKEDLSTARVHEADVARVITNLSLSTKTPVIVSESDLDREAIAAGVALKIAAGEVPDSLRHKRIYRLRLDALAKDAQTSEEFAGRVQAVLAEAAQAEGQIILFVDQLHEYAGARAAFSTSASLKQALENHRVQIIGGASPESYASYIAADETVAGLFQSILIDRFAG